MSDIHRPEFSRGQLAIMTLSCECCTRTWLGTELQVGSAQYDHFGATEPKLVSDSLFDAVEKFDLYNLLCIRGGQVRIVA